MTVTRKVIDTPQIRADFDRELSRIEDMFLLRGIDPDYIADTYRGSAKESARLWKRRNELHREAEIY